MAKHIVKCKVCGIEFDANTTEWVKYGSRLYAHKTCSPDGKDIVPKSATKKKKVDSTDPALIELKDYINNIYGNKANWPMINRQIKQYHTENKYSYSSMKKVLEYFYIVNNNSPDESNGGIGIIPFVYDNAYQYYYKIWLAQQNSENKTLNTKIIEFTIKPPKARGTKNELLDWELEINDEE